jgi:hypothetical protein
MQQTARQEKIRLIARIRLLENELDVAQSVLQRMQGADGEMWLLRQLRGYERDLAETEAAYRVHVPDTAAQGRSILPFRFSTLSTVAYRSPRP